MRNGRFLITNTIEAPRLAEEEHLKAQGWEFAVEPWWQAGDPVSRLAAGARLGSDWPYPGAVDLNADLARLRALLTPEEGERFRATGALCAQAMAAAIGQVRPGQSEYEISALLQAESERRGVQPIVSLIAADERIFNFRHPIPTASKLARYAMLVVCGRRQGLVCSLTRLVYFGRLPDELRRKSEATATVDATLIAATRPGASLGEVFARGQAAYAAAGFADEWQLHHQGGPASYEPRDWVATPASTDVVVAGQAYAWNPSITGTKSEDTILVGEDGNDVITDIPGWPMLTVSVDGQSWQRPAVLEIRD
jgi:antitoxin VapB